MWPARSCSATSPPGCRSGCRCPRISGRCSARGCAARSPRSPRCSSSCCGCSTADRWDWRSATRGRAWWPASGECGSPPPWWGGCGWLGGSRCRGAGACDRVNDDCLKLTIYFGERDRSGGHFLADALVDLFGRERLATSVLLRGTEGFGAKQRLQTQRLLTLSEDLPVVAVAVDSRERIEALLPEVTSLTGDGLVTLERARLLSGGFDGEVQLPGPAKLTVYCGRGEPVLELIALLHRRGVAGATALLGVDGTAHGERRRARFFGRNLDVPLMVISVGDGEQIAAVLPEIGALLRRPLVTLERITVCRRDGAALAEPGAAPRTWQKLMIYTSEQARHGRHPLHVALIRRLREEHA